MYGLRKNSCTWTRPEGAHEVGYGTSGLFASLDPLGLGTAMLSRMSYAVTWVIS